MALSVLSRVKNSPFISDLIELKGNAKAKILTEPLWGIPMNLYAPYATLFMVALGVSDSQIGIILSTKMVLQIFWALLSGVLVDKFGRRRMAFFADLFAWSIPAFLWTFSQNFWWFMAAAVSASVVSISSNAGNLIFVEDLDQRKLVNVYAWVNITSLLAVFFAPISMYFVGKFSVVPTIRVIYAIAFVSMTLKFLLYYKFTRETEQGKRKIEEFKNVSLWKMLGSYKDAFRIVFHSKPTLTVLVILVSINITSTINSSFFSVIANLNLGVPAEYIAVFPMVRAVIMLIFFFLLQNRFNRLSFKAVMLTGILFYLVSNLMLILARPETGWMLVVYIFADAFGFALLTPRKDSILVLFVDPKERAKIVSVILMLMITISSPFGWIAGALSDWNRALPFALSLVVFAACGVTVLCSKSIASLGRNG